eukprot:6960192-Prymnesium_polylepis.2
MLATGTTVESGAGEKDNEPGRGASLGPIGVSACAERVGVGDVGRVSNAEMLGPDEIHEHADEAHVQSLSRKRKRAAKEPHGRENLRAVLGRVEQCAVERAVLLHKRLGCLGAKRRCFLPLLDERLVGR